MVATSKKNKEKKELLKQQVYLGPSFKDVVHQRVYIGDLPKELTDLIDKCPMAQHLVVKINDYEQGLKDLQEKGSVMNTSALKVQDFLLKEKE